MKLISMEHLDTVYENDVFSLVPITTEALAEQYLEVRIEDAFLPSLYEDETARQTEMEEVLEDRTFYCGIISKGAGVFTGYCGINNIFAETPELAIAILKKYQHKGYGFEALNAFMKTVKEMTGIAHFIAKVDPENAASRQLMIKLGFKPAGIATFLIDDEDKLRRLEEENMEYLTKDLVELAGEFNVEPRKLLSHLLVYAIDL